MVDDPVWQFATHHKLASSDAASPTSRTTRASSKNTWTSRTGGVVRRSSAHSPHSPDAPNILSSPPRLHSSSGGCRPAVSSTTSYRLKPERVAAFVVNKGGIYYWRSSPRPRSYCRASCSRAGRTSSSGRIRSPALRGQSARRSVVGARGRTERGSHRRALVRCGDRVLRGRTGSSSRQLTGRHRGTFGTEIHSRESRVPRRFQVQDVSTGRRLPGSELSDGVAADGARRPRAWQALVTETPFEKSAQALLPMLQRTDR